MGKKKGVAGRGLVADLYSGISAAKSHPALGIYLEHFYVIDPREINDSYNT